jgi:hypothetical protein
MRKLTPVLAIALAFASACTHSDATSTLDIPLTQPGPDGNLYHLSGTFAITAGDGSLVAVDGSGTSDSVSVELPPGITSVLLQPGWALSKSSDGGATFAPVDAILASANPALLRVLGNQPATVSFMFLIRDPNGDLTITFGVDTSPRELAGGIIVQSTTGDFMGPYDHARMDLSIYYTLASLDKNTLVDGSKQEVFTAGSVGIEVFNDPVGTEANVVAPAMAGGFLFYTVTVHPDGTQEVDGEFDGANSPFTVLHFGPHTLDPSMGEVLIPLDADGFAQDVFFYDPFMTFTQTTSLDTGDATLTGQLRLRFIPN